MKYYIGIDLGGTNIVAAVVNEEGVIISKTDCKTNLPRIPELVADDMAKISEEAVLKAGLTMDQIENVGIGSPGIINPSTGEIEYSCNFNYYNVPMSEMMNKRLKKPIYIDNDANTAAIGEFAVGAGRGIHSMIAITLGTGIGGGIILNDKIYSGFNYAGGELGHTVIQMDGRPCNCGRKGCFEAYASATGLIKTTIEYMEKNPDSQMWQVAQGRKENVNGRTSFDAMRLGDKAAKDVVDTFIRHLAAGLTNVINIFQPELVCIGGGISKEGDTLIKPLRLLIDQEDYARSIERRTQIVAAKLGNDAGIIGAAMLSQHQ